MKDNKKLTFIIISVFGIPREYSASERVFALLKSLYKEGFEVHYITEEIDCKSKNDLTFAETIVLKRSILQKLERFFIGLLFRFIKKSDKQNTKPQTNQTAFTRQKKVNELKKRLLCLRDFFTFNRQHIPVLRMVVAAFKLTKKINKESPNSKVVLITSAAVGSTHLVGCLLKKIFRKNLIFVASYHDPLEFDPYSIYDTCLPLKLTNNCVFKNADLIIPASKPVAEKLIKVALSRNIDISKKTEVIYTGVQESDLITYSTTKSFEQNQKKLKIAYTGTIYENHLLALEVLLKAIENLIKRSNWSIRFYYAGLSSGILKQIIKSKFSEKLQSALDDLGFITKEETQKIQLNSDCLILLMKPKSEDEYSALTGKIFEYLKFKKPILVVGDSNEEINELFKDSKYVFITEFDERDVENKLLKIVNFLSEKHPEDIFEIPEELKREENIKKLIKRIRKLEI